MTKIKIRLLCLATLMIMIPSLAYAFIYVQQSLNITQTIKKAWYNSSWQYRKAITILGSQVSGPNDLANFPVLISLTDSDLASDAQDDGDDILFTASDKKTKLSHEIEAFDGLTGQLYAWVKIPKLFTNNNTLIYMYYGNPSAASQQDAVNVWESNYVGVWHLKENPTGTAPQMKDSTSNAHHGTTTGMVSGDQTGGKMDGSLNFDGTDAYVQTTSGESKTASNITWSVWFKADSTTGSHHILWEGPAIENGWGNPGVPSSHEMHLSIGRMTTANLLDFFYGYEYTTGNWVPAVEIQTSFTDTANWHYAVVVLTGAGSSPSGTLYLDGSLIGTDTGTETGRSGWNTNLRIGRCGTAERYLDGIADEVRVSTTARSAAWIETEYNNQSNPSSFYNIGTEETQ
jgi:hypothetical protein